MQGAKIIRAPLRWVEVHRKVPKDSVLGFFLFTVYMSDTDAGLSCSVDKFADDTKLGGELSSYLLVRCLCESPQAREMVKSMADAI